MSSSEVLLRLADGLREGARSRDRSPAYGNRACEEEKKSERLFLRAKAMLRVGDKLMAAQLLKQASELDGMFFDAMEAQGEILDSIGDTVAAAAMYKRAREGRRNVRPGPPDRHFVLRQRGRFVAEVMAYDSVLRSLKKNTLPFLARGNAHLVAGRPELALADYERALRLKRDTLSTPEQKCIGWPE